MFRPVTLFHIETMGFVQGEGALEIVGWVACRLDPVSEIFFRIDDGPLISGSYGFSDASFDFSERLRSGDW